MTIGRRSPRPSLLIAALCAVLGVTSAAAKTARTGKPATPANEGGGPPVLPPLQVEAEAEYVLGFPLHVAVTVSAGEQDKRRLHVGSWYDIRLAFGIVVRAAESGKVVHERHPLWIDDPYQYTPVSLRRGQSMRTMLDFSEYLGDTLSAGSYEITVLYGDLLTRTQSESLKIRVRGRTAVEERELQALRADRERASSWGEWAKSKPPESDMSKLALPTDRRDPLRFYRVVRYLKSGQTPLKSIPLTSLDVLDGIFTPEREGLRAELIAARDPQAGQKEAAAVRAKHPGLAWWMSSVERGDTLFH